MADGVGIWGDEGEGFRMMLMLVMADSEVRHGG